MEQKYFKKYLEQAPLSLAIWRSLEAAALNRFKLKRPILDLGCGFGEFAGVFFESVIEAGIDIDTKDLIMAAKKKKYKKLIAVDARGLSFKNDSFNSVISISSIEHINQVEKVFPEVFRILKRNGLFVFTVPTLEINQLLIFPYPKKFWLKLYHLVFKHKVIIKKEKWLKMARDAGFQIEYTQGLLTKKQLLWFQLGLISAIPSQISRFLTGDRFIFGLDLKTKILTKLLKNVLNDQNFTDANIIVVARKNK